MPERLMKGIGLIAKKMAIGEVQIWRVFTSGSLLETLLETLIETLVAFKLVAFRSKNV